GVGWPGRTGLLTGPAAQGVKEQGQNRDGRRDGIGPAPANSFGPAGAQKAFLEAANEGGVGDFGPVGGAPEARAVAVGDVLGSFVFRGIWFGAHGDTTGGYHSVRRLRARARKVARKALRARASCDSTAFSVSRQVRARSRTLRPATYLASRASR